METAYGEQWLDTRWGQTELSATTLTEYCRPACQDQSLHYTAWLMTCQHHPTGPPHTGGHHNTGGVGSGQWQLLVLLQLSGITAKMGKGLKGQNNHWGIPNQHLMSWILQQLQPEKTSLTSPVENAVLKMPPSSPPAVIHTSHTPLTLYQGTTGYINQTDSLQLPWENHKNHYKALPEILWAKNQGSLC